MNFQGHHVLSLKSAPKPCMLVIEGNVRLHELIEAWHVRVFGLAINTEAFQP